MENYLELMMATLLAFLLETPLDEMLVTLKGCVLVSGMEIPKVIMLDFLLVTQLVDEWVT